MEFSRNFEIFRTEWPAIFRFNGKLFQEEHDIDRDDVRWMEIREDTAQRWLNAMEAEESFKLQSSRGWPDAPDETDSPPTTPE